MNVNYSKIVYNFTDREIEVVELLIKGYTINQISEELEIGVRTIETHIQKVKKKLKVKSMCQLGSKYTTIKILFDEEYVYKILNKENGIH